MRSTIPPHLDARRACLPTTFEARDPKSSRLWRKIFSYYGRHAGRVWHSPAMREEVRRKIAISKAVVEDTLNHLRAELPAGRLEAYDARPIIEHVSVEARFPEVMEYIDLFRQADRAFCILHDAELRPTLVDPRKRSVAISEALRAPAQVVADTPPVRRVDAAQPG